MLDRAELLSLVVCPVCAARLPTFARCPGCGTEFGEDDGTPRLIPPAYRRTVEFTFESHRATVGQGFRNCFRCPPRRGAAGGAAPYHLDLAHLDVLKGLTGRATVLEVGCGGGQMRSFVEGLGYRYVGADVSKTRVYDWLRAHGGPDLLADAHCLPFADGSVDLVYTAAVTEHLACPYLVAQEVARVLRPGGFYLGNVAFLEPWHDDSFFHMSPLGVYELLTQAGLDIGYIWPGQGYSGFRAILDMSGRVTKSLQLLGDLMYLVYRAGNRARDLVRGRGRGGAEGITDRARVAGAIDWIASRPAAARPAAAHRSAGELAAVDS